VKDYKIEEIDDWQLKDRQFDDELDRRLVEQTEESYRLIDEEIK